MICDHVIGHGFSFIAVLIGVLITAASIAFIMDR